jgi:LuxR family maltose regulon positive regulatory protein
VVSALAYLAIHDAEQASATLEKALLRAQPQGYARVFLDYGVEIRDLLLRLRRNIGTRERALQPAALLDYIDGLLAAFDREENRPGSQEKPAARQATADAMVLTALSEREKEVLMLVARGASNQEIADRLVLSLATVKSHVNHIMNKLLAQNRLEAVSRAREMGWIP